MNSKMEVLDNFKTDHKKFANWNRRCFKGAYVVLEKSLDNINAGRDEAGI